MGCSNEGPFNGGTYNNAVLVDPEISGGHVANSELVNIHLSQNVSVDDAVAQQLAQFLCQYIADCVSFPAETMAAVFTDCSGKAHTPGTAIPSCEDMNNAIANAVAPNLTTDKPGTTEAGEECDMPTTIVGKDRTQLLGGPDAYIKIGDYLIPAYTKA